MNSKTNIMPPKNGTLVDYSIIIPVYFNEGSLTSTLDALFEEVINKNQELSCEVIFIDDGSRDGSLQELFQLREKNPEIVKIIKFTRNFGQVSAIFAGFAHATGKCVVVLSADGQDPPSLINDMLNAYFHESYEIVLCARDGRDESAYRIATSKMFYSLMRKLSFENMPLGGFDYFLLGRRALDTVLQNHEAHGFLQGQILWTGYNTKFLQYKRRNREVGKSRWSFGKKITYLIDGVMSYSFVPIRMMSIIGGMVALIGFLYAIILFIIRIGWGHPVEGWTALSVLVLVLGGLQLLMSGIIGEYLWRTLAQSRNRDPYVIDQVYD